MTHGNRPTLCAMQRQKYKSTMPKTQANQSRVHVVLCDTVVVVANKGHEIAHQGIRCNKEGNEIKYRRDTRSWFSSQGCYRYLAFIRYLRPLCHDDMFLERTQEL